MIQAPERANQSKGKKTMHMKARATVPEIPGCQLAQKMAVALVLLCIYAAAPILFGQQDIHAPLTPLAKRKPAPAFALATENGKKIQVSDYRGKVLLLNFWATDCGGCVLEIPSFIEMQKAYRDKGFTAVGVSMDISYEGLKNADEAWSRVKPFVAKHGVNYPIAMGDDAISRAYALNSFPATYLIDKSGKVAAAYVGVVINKDNVVRNIESLLSEPVKE
jgi:peroxiredoxin